MFYALAIALCLAVLFLVLLCATLVCAPSVRLLIKSGQHSSPGTKANLVFVARILPLALACLVTLSLTLPAFLKYEPHVTSESMGLRLAGLAGLGAIVLIAIVVRALRILRATWDVQSEWLSRSKRIFLDRIALPIYRVDNGASLLAVTGMFRPRIFVSREIAEGLSAEEFRAAVAHELAHVSSFDNLKQLLMKMTRPPRWLKMLHSVDAEWIHASEIAADHKALAEGAPVLELSAALVKVGRLSLPCSTRPAVASHLVPPACASSLEMRVARLSALLEGREAAPVQKAGKSKFTIAILCALAAYAACINMFLPGVHEVLEFLVR